MADLQPCDCGGRVYWLDNDYWRCVGCVPCPLSDPITIHLYPQPLPETITPRSDVEIIRCPDRATWLRELVDALLAGFSRDIRADPHRKDVLRDWTQSVYRSCRKLGEQYRHDVFCSDGKSGHCEYLLDIVWFNPHTYRPDLVIECEWGNVSAVTFDSEKLLWSKAPFKVLICDPQNGNPLPAISEKIRKYPDHLEGETYAVIIVGGYPGGGETRVFSWKPSHQGPHTEVNFLEIPESPFHYVLLPRELAEANTDDARSCAIGRRVPRT
jgi:hypothetical protein